MVEVDIIYVCNASTTNRVMSSDGGVNIGNSRIDYITQTRLYKVLDSRAVVPKLFGLRPQMQSWPGLAALKCVDM